MRIIGIDPGINKTGYGIIDYHANCFKTVEYGCIVPLNSTTFQEKMLSICKQVEKILIAHNPNIAIVEDIFYAVNAQTALKLGQIRGALMMTISSQNISIAELTPLEIKKGMTGYGRAEKNQVAEMVRIVLGLAETPIQPDTTDALAAAIVYAVKGDFDRTISEQFLKNKNK
jgi:crossover junction endodeoxyribonuclease RuvC